MNKQEEKVAKRINVELFYGKKLTKKEKVMRIYDYLYENVQYAKGENDDELYTAYSALCKGRAYCQGYAAAFNMLCRIAGVESVGIVKKEHIFNAVKTEDGILYCDLTYEDSYAELSAIKRVSKKNLCCVSYKDMEKLHGKFDTPLEIYFTLE